MAVLSGSALTIDSSVGDGVQTFSGSVTSLNSATITNNDGDGIDASGDLSLDTVTVSGNYGVGIQVEAGSLSTMTATTITGNQNGGLFNYGDITNNGINSTLNGFGANVGFTFDVLNYGTMVPEIPDSATVINIVH